MALPIWGYYMNKVYEDSTLNVSKLDFEKPTGMLDIQLDCRKYRSNKDADFDYEEEIDGAEEEYYGEF